MATLKRIEGNRFDILCPDYSPIIKERLNEFVSKEEIEIFPLAATSLDLAKHNIIICGIIDSPEWKEFTDALNIPVMDNLPNIPGSYIFEWKSVNDRNILFCLGKDFTGLLYSIEDLLSQLLSKVDGFTFLENPKFESPRFPIRLLWTWDHSTNWALGYEGQIDWGCMNTYTKSPEAFIADFKKMIDWAGRHRFNGIIIWGFLRDSHGGVKACQELINYAKVRGVRILAGIGTSFYGGLFYEGNHPFNANTWLHKHPNYAARGMTGELTNRLCPSEPANQKWLKEGIHWLLETFDIGGVNLESGDFMVCYCDRCQKKRNEVKTDDPDFFKEMYISINPVIEEILSVRDDLWITFGTYTGFNPRPLPKDMGKPDPTVVLNMANMGQLDSIIARGFPKQTITQWSLTAMLNQVPVPMLNFITDGRPEAMLSSPDWPIGMRPPNEHSVGYLHQGSQWYNRGGFHTRYQIEISSIKEACLRGSEAGFEGLAISGEVASTYTPCELNYLAMSHFSYHPDDSLIDFAKNKLASLVGGAELSIKFVTFMAKREAGQMTKVDENQLDEILKKFMDNVQGGGDWHAYRRWRWLSTFRTAHICDGTSSVL